MPALLRRPRTAGPLAGVVAVLVALTVLMATGSSGAVFLDLGGKQLASALGLKLASYDAPTSAEGQLQTVQSQLSSELGQMTWSVDQVPATVPSTASINAVSDATPGAVWAVGDNCLLLFSDPGSTWQQVSVPGCTSNLTGIYLQDPNHGWAVGSGGTVLVCSTACTSPAANWSVLANSPISADTSLNGVWAQDPNDVFVVGTTSAGAGQIWACSRNCSAATATVATSSPPPPPPPTPPCGARSSPPASTCRPSR